MALFYGVCIWVRLAMAASVGMALCLGSRALGFAVFVVALAAALLLATSDKTTVWWSRKIHAALAVVVSLSALLSALMPRWPCWVTAALLAVDVSVGVASAMRQNPWSIAQ
jgi:hypothetical protein